MFSITAAAQGLDPIPLPLCLGEYSSIELLLSNAKAGIEKFRRGISHRDSVQVLPVRQIDTSLDTHLQPWMPSDHEPKLVALRLNEGLDD